MVSEGDKHIHSKDNLYKLGIYGANQEICNKITLNYLSEDAGLLYDIPYASTPCPKDKHGGEDDIKAMDYLPLISIMKEEVKKINQMINHFIIATVE